MPPATPVDVLARRRQLMLDGDADGFTDLFAPDAVIEFTFHGPPGGGPVRLEGQEVIREYSRRIMTSPLKLEAYEVTELYQAQDPEVVIVEMLAQATLPAGRPMTATSIQVLRIREGRIVLCRDFADPRLLAEVTGDRDQ
jgi:ketosteroid isomerase-like protein